MLGTVLPARATASPPANDAFLLATPVSGLGSASGGPAHFTQDTTDATTQPDLFNPPSAGGPPETLTCRGIRLGRTIWYDVRAEQPGTLDIQTSGFDSVISAYDFDPILMRIRRTLGCVNDPGLSENALLALEPDRSYRVQIGGVDTGAGAAGGMLQTSFEFFPDRDRDGIFDELDKCGSVPGVARFAGCLPELRPRVRVTWSTFRPSVRIDLLRVSRVPRGTRIRARCAVGCAVSEQQTYRRGRSVTLKRFTGRSLQPRATFLVTVRKPATGTGMYRFGAIGYHGSFRVRRGGIVRTERCLMPGASRPRRRCA